ncbi:hypothetical protein [Flavobacterium selenitireducens]|uniref:hypothetical protein n=1 Tax=Flavobacterium selenitireducens TaxID=2722704 RepID=UPI00168B11AD|nr:hypothetical protein [Flavobacterium selenitireducens]MBD3581560.1 hypothetical protein [Flavobacterium selenitireducens]
MKNPIVFLIIIIIVSLMFGCRGEKPELTGKYKTYQTNLVDRAFRSIVYDSWVVGTSLDLKSDSTFILINCSMKMKGKWTATKDSLLLKVSDKKFRIDSLNYSTKWNNWRTINKKPISFKIKGKFLETIYSDSIENKILEKLEKTN